MSMQNITATEQDSLTGYRAFRLCAFHFSRDDYFATVRCPAKEVERSHTLPVDAFLRAIMRDVAWGFFYGWVNFDDVIGTRNHYGRVDLYAGAYNEAMKKAGIDHTEQFDTAVIMATFKAI